jgi:hypothetical protein
MGVTPLAFEVVRTGTVADAAIQEVTGAGAVYLVRVLVGPGQGKIRLRLRDTGEIADLLGNPLGGFGPDNGSFLGPNVTIS